MTVIKVVETTSNNMKITSSRSMLRADPPIPHGETVVTYWGTSSVRIMYDRGTLMHAVANDIVAWLGSRFVDMFGGRTMIGDSDGLHAVEYGENNSTTLRHAQRGDVTYQSRPSPPTSALEILRWYARVAPDTAPTVTAAAVLGSLWPVPRWAHVPP